MDLPVLSTLVSFLDINNFQDCSGQIEILSTLSDSEKHFVLSFWLKHTHFSATTYVGNYAITIYTRNFDPHRDNDRPAIIKNNSSEWFLCGKRHRKQGRPAIVFDDDDEFKEWFLNGKLVKTTGWLQNQGV